MPTKEEVLRLIQSGHSYQDAAEELAIHPGEAYLTATGWPADGSDSIAPEDHDRRGMLTGSTQFLVNPPPENPTKKKHVLEWLKARAAQDTAMQEAARRREAEQPEKEVTALLSAEHDRLKLLLEQLQTPADPAQIRQDLARTVLEFVERHEAAEEAHLWPLVHIYVDGGAELVDKALSQEHATNAIRDALIDMSVENERFDELARHLGQQLFKHFAFEDQVFSILKHTVDEKARKRVGAKIPAAEGIDKEPR